MANAGNARHALDASFHSSMSTRAESSLTVFSGDHGSERRNVREAIRETLASGDGGAHPAGPERSASNALETRGLNALAMARDLGSGASRRGRCARTTAA